MPVFVLYDKLPVHQIAQDFLQMYLHVRNTLSVVPNTSKHAKSKFHTLPERPALKKTVKHAKHTLTTPNKPFRPGNVGVVSGHLAYLARKSLECHSIPHCPWSVRNHPDPTLSNHLIAMNGANRRLSMSKHV
jgi:hypothetical protein